MRYKFSWRRWIFWHTKEVAGHRWEENQNKMVLHFPNGGIQEVKRWKDCECRLGADWYNQTLRNMELTAGQKIPTTAINDA